jgi:hypothetical protein
VGLGVLAAGALPHVATAPISDLYHAPGATPEDQATLVLIRQATQGIFDALFVVGLLLLPIGVIALGVAMLGEAVFGKGFGGVSVVIGVVGVVAASVLLVDPLSASAFVGVLAPHRVPSRRGMEALQSLEVPVGSLEDLGPSLCSYSPCCLQDEFSEIPMQNRA